MAIKHLDEASAILSPQMAAALRRAELGDRAGFAAALHGIPGNDLDGLQLELNAWTRTGRVDPLDAAVALFDIFQARREAKANSQPIRG
jgi:hypothetical protein